MPSRDPYTCCVCKKVHKGIHCWSDDSDEEIESGLLKAMATLVPKKTPGVPRRESRLDSLLSTDTWERGESSSFQDEDRTTPSAQRQATTSLSRPRQENETSSINAIVPDANAHLRQSLEKDNGSPHRRVDSGNQEWRRNNEHRPSPKPDYAYSQVSMVPQPLRIPGRQAQRQPPHRMRSDECAQTDPRAQPDSQHRRSNEHERALHTARQSRCVSGYLQREEAQYQSRTNHEHGDRAPYQQERQESRMPPPAPPPRTSQTYCERSDPPQTYRISQETPAHSRGVIQSSRRIKPQPTATPTLPRALPTAPTASGTNRIRLSRRASGETTITQFMNAGRAPPQGQEQGRARIDIQQAQRTGAENRPRAKQGPRAVEPSRSDGYAQVRSRRPSEASSRPVTELGDFRDADRILTRERELRDAQQQLQRKNEEEERRRGDQEVSGQVTLPIGNLQRQFQRAKEEEDAWNAARRRNHDRRNHDGKRHHGSIRRRRRRRGGEESETHKTHKRPPTTSKHPISSSPKQQAARTTAAAEEAAAPTSHHLANQSQQSKGGRRTRIGRSRNEEDEPRHTPPKPHNTSHNPPQRSEGGKHRPAPPSPRVTALVTPQNNHHHRHDHQVETGTKPSPPSTLPHPNHTPILPRTFFFSSDTGIMGREGDGDGDGEGEGARRQTHWERALRRLEGRLEERMGDEMDESESESEGGRGVFSVEEFWG